MKIKRIKLVTLLDKQDCKEFDNHIIELLKEQYSEEEIDISSKLHLLIKCNAKQLELLKSIGIEPKREWSRNTEVLKSNYYVVERDIDKGFSREHYYDDVNLNPNFIFDTKEEAEHTALYFRTYLQIKSWIKHHHPKWNPDWTNGTYYKWGITLKENELKIDWGSYYNSYVFGLSVPTEKAVELLLKEFKEDLTTLFIK